ncbi:MAG: RNA methyltransferase [Blautia sp.]|nr:RNA methyltransferase [Blautia sp.]
MTGIKDFEDPRLAPYARLKENQLLHYYEPQPGLFIAESAKVIRRAIAAGYEPVSFLMEERIYRSDAADLTRQFPQTDLYLIEHEAMTQLRGYELTGGFLCAMKRKRLPAVSEICREAKMVAVLERVMNPTNLGAIFRSAAAMFVDALVLSPGCTDPLYRRAARVSMGTVFQVPWTVFPGDMEKWEKDATQLFREMGFTTIALALREDAVSLDCLSLPPSARLAVFLGSEGDGLSAASIAQCDHTVMIPMSHGVDSLNVAAASAVAFWQLAKG